MKRFLAIMLALVMVLALVPMSFAEGEDTVEIKVLATSDIHGVFYHTDYTATSGQRNQGLTRIATAVKEVREANENVLLIDNGDTIQGTPLTYYYAFYQPEVQDPAMKALRVMDYDAWVLGNHEFNYGLDILNRQIADAKADPVVVTTGVKEDSVAVLAANLLDKDNADTFEPWIEDGAYIVKEFDGVKVGVIGMNTPNVPAWEKEANYEGIEFESFVATWNHYADILKTDEGCDIVIAACHSGLEKAGDLVDGEYYQWENQLRALIEQTTGIDFVIGGHSHSVSVNTVNNKDGEKVTVLHTGSAARYLGIGTLVYDKTTGELTVSAQNKDCRNYTVDTELEAALAPYEETVWDEYLNEVIGVASEDFAAPGGMTEPNAFLDLVNRVQLEATGAQMSLSAPLNSNSGAVIPKGNITLGQMFQLYKYENWLYNIDMTGAEIKEWLEFAATKYSVNGANVHGGGMYCDTLYGEGVYYEIWVDEEVGNRIHNLQYQNQPIDPEATYEVAINNYRFTGGGNYIANVSTMEPEDTDRINYSTQFDMDQGEDKGQVRNLMADYIRALTAAGKTLDPVVESDFEIVRTMDIAVTSTTDMHGRSTALDATNGNASRTSMVRAATIIKDLRSQTDNMLLVDAGDTIQGTLVATYWITKETEKLNPMIDAMATLGYDAWIMGNHEFNYNPAQRDTQVAFAEAAGISAMSANLVLLTDGTNAYGESVAAGEPFYKPYITRTYTDDLNNEVKIALIGLGNANNASWDVSTNYPNLQFSSLGNDDGDIVYEIHKWVDIVEEKESPDIIIVAAHTGAGDTKEDGTFTTESQAIRAVKETRGVDLFINGHDHGTYVREYQNLDGENIYLMNGGGSAVANAVFTCKYDMEGNFLGYELAKPETYALKDVEDDAEMAEQMQPYYDATEAWVTAPLGNLAGEWVHFSSNNSHVMEQSETLDLVHKAQIWATWLSYESDGIEGATVSLASPVFNNFDTTPREVNMRDMITLYRYENTLYAIDMTGAQLKAWLNHLANNFELDAEGQIKKKSSANIFGMDTVYGIDYVFDISQPEGERLVRCFYNGAELKDDEVIRVAINNYRLSGDYGWNETVGIPDTEAVWSAAYYLGADRSQVKVLLGEYFSYMETVTADDEPFAGKDSDWYMVNAPQLYYEELIAAIENAIEVYETEGQENFSEELLKVWEDTINAAIALLENEEATQEMIDQAAMDLLNLSKTGESVVVYVFAGVAILALVGMAVLIMRKRRTN